MGFTETLLSKYNIKMNERSPEVDLNLGTVRTLIDENQYAVGNFLNRLFKRLSLIDEFRTDYIAYAQFLPEIRKISIVINPLMLWDRILRPTAMHMEIAKESINRIDKLLLNALKDGGWTKESFREWIDFMKSTDVAQKSNYYDRNNSFTTSFLSVIIHEVLHVVWNHISFQRIDQKCPKEEQQYNQVLSNIAQDFAINQTLKFGVLDEMFMTTSNTNLLFSFFDGGAPMVNSGKAITDKNIKIEDFDTNIFLNQPFEYYLDLLKKAKPENVEKVAGKKIPSTMFGKGSGKGDGEGGSMYDLFKHVFGEMSPEDLKEMQNILAGEGEQQFEDFNPMTSDMKKVASNDLKRVIDEMLEKGEIEDPREICDQHPFKINNYFSKVIDNLYPTETLSWEHILSHYVRKALGAEDNSYSMKRESRAVPEMFPGKERHEGLDLNIIVDVSGSICHEEFNRFVNEIEKIARDVDVPFVRYIQFHSNVAFDEYVPLSSIRGIGIKSTGGTCLASALDLLKQDKNSTLTVVFTDGYVEESVKAADYEYETLLFLSSSGRGYASDALRSRGFRVIHQDGDNSWFNDV